MQRSLLFWLLLLLLLFLGLGGLYGGIAMLADLSGRSLQMETVLPLDQGVLQGLPGTCG
jgi:hypothetical protein